MGVGAAVLSAWVGTGSELRVHFFNNATVEDNAGRHVAFWDHLQAEVRSSGYFLPMAPNF